MQVASNFTCTRQQQKRNTINVIVFNVGHNFLTGFLDQCFFFLTIWISFTKGNNCYYINCWKKNIYKMSLLWMLLWSSKYSLMLGIVSWLLCYWAINILFLKSIVQIMFHQVGQYSVKLEICYLLCINLANIWRYFGIFWTWNLNSLCTL